MDKQAHLAPPPSDTSRGAMWLPTGIHKRFFFLICNGRAPVVLSSMPTWRECCCRVESLDIDTRWWNGKRNIQKNKATITWLSCDCRGLELYSIFGYRRGVTWLHVTCRRGGGAGWAIMSTVEPIQTETLVQDQARELRGTLYKWVWQSRPQPLCSIIT